MKYSYVKYCYDYYDLEETLENHTELEDDCFSVYVKLYCDEYCGGWQLDDIEVIGWENNKDFHELDQKLCEYIIDKDLIKERYLVEE